MNHYRILGAIAASSVFAGCASSPAEVSQTQPDRLKEDQIHESDPRRIARRPSEAKLRSQREAAEDGSGCTFRAGALPEETVGREMPLGHDNPIKKVVILMQENRSFDHYFGKLNKYRKAKGMLNAQNVADVPRAEHAWNPKQVQDPKKGRIPLPPGHPDRVDWQEAIDLCASDTPHDWWAAHLQVNSGMMDGFYQSAHNYFEKNEPNVDGLMCSDGATPVLDGSRAMWYHTEKDIPFYYDLATQFAIADHYHSSVSGPTYVNRDFLYGATSFGLTYNTLPDLPGNAMGIDHRKNPVAIMDLLSRAGVDWRIYVDGRHIVSQYAPRVASFLGRDPLQLAARGLADPAAGRVRYFRPGGAAEPASVKGFFAQAVNFFSRLRSDFADVMSDSSFFENARDGKLPAVSFIDADIQEDAGGNDEHAPSDIQRGQQFTAEVVRALMASPDWKHTALFITYDEHGGFYDHVVPPPACIPDDVSRAPIYEEEKGKMTDRGRADSAMTGGFDRYGVRVPLIVVSPYAKRNYVGHDVYDHTSIVRFVESLFNLPALTNRDANANPLIDMFDFSVNPEGNPELFANVPEKSFELPPVDRAKLDFCLKTFAPVPMTLKHLAEQQIPTRLAENPYEHESAVDLTGCVPPTCHEAH